MKFLVIGLGSIGSRHAKNLAVLGHDITAYDPRYLQEKGIEFPKYVGAWPLSLKDIEQDFDGCLICTPTAHHEEDLRYALDRGWKHILVEKPIAASVNGKLEEDLDYAKDVGIKVVMGNNLRFHPSARLAKRYIRDGVIGNPIWAHVCVAQYNDKPDYRRDGVTLNWGAHELDLALWLLGPVAKVASANIDDIDTIADIGMLHENGCLTTVHLDYLTNPEMRQSVIIGDKGRIVVGIKGRYVVLQQGEHGRPPDQQEGSFDDDYKNEMVAFANMCQGKTWPGATAEDGLETLKIIDAARTISQLSWDERMMQAFPILKVKS